jgi:hypothetical protein
MLVAALAASVLAALALASPASAATTSQWASWGPFEGTGGAFTSSVTIANTPAITATMTSDSRAGQVGVISGASTWLAQGTPPGAIYGSSQNKPYVNLRPRADSPTAPSTTTYSFANPTPTSGWMFALGDLDADKVSIRAVGPDGTVLDSTQIGFMGGFNYCAPGTVGKPSCAGSATDVPSWDPGTQTLTGNVAAADTNGAAAWFQPSAPISSLSFIYTQRSGFPVYQTWFASLARDITGTVTATTGSAAGAVLTLRDANGNVVATTTTAADGSYSFPGVQASDGYTVSIDPPGGMIATGATTATVNLAQTDGVADFTMRQVVPVAVSGTVTVAGGAPVAGVTVEIPGVGSVVTRSDGSYLFDQVPVGDHTISIPKLPDGYSGATPASITFTVPQDSEDPIGGKGFTLTPDATLGGVVTAGGVGVPGVTLTAQGPGGSTAGAVTGDDGSYSFGPLPPGDYTIQLATPDGYVPVGSDSLTQPLGDKNITNADFALGKLGAVSGSVLQADGTPVPGATVTVDGPGGATPVTTDADGGYALGALEPGDYTITLTVPPGFDASGPTERSVTITDEGQTISGQDFTVDAAPTPPPTPPAGGGQSGTSTAGMHLAATGSDVTPPFLVGGVLLVGGAVALTMAARRRRRLS